MKKVTVIAKRNDDYYHWKYISAAGEFAKLNINTKSNDDN